MLSTSGKVGDKLWLLTRGGLYYVETRDGKKYFDPGPKSKEMERLNRTFSRMHGASALTNLISLGVAVYYGFLLAERFQ